MKKISIIVASLLLASNLSAEDNITTAIKAGTVSGDVTLYGEKQNNSGSNKDAGFTSGSIGLNYETGSLNGFKAAVGFRGNHDFSEEEDGDYSNDETTKTIFHTANISYANEYANFKLGRQEIDLEWMEDFHEAGVLGITAIPNTTVVLGLTQRIAVADADAPLENFHDFGEDIDYAAVIDAKYEGVKGLVVNPYYYKADNLAKWYGLKLDYDTEMFGITTHGAKSNEDVTGTKDGQILHFEGRTSFAGLGLNLGYISTDNDGGAGSMAELGDHINPLEDGNQVYETDADTAYLGLAYEVSGVELGALYGQTKYSGDKENELNLMADYGITDNLAIGALFVDVDAQDSNDDYNKITLTVEYSF